MQEDKTSPAGQSKGPSNLLPDAEPMAIRDIRDALVIRERDLFFLTDRSGEAPRSSINGYGLYHSDTRYLSAYEFAFSSAKPITLLSTAELGYSSEQVLTNPTMMDVDGQELLSGTVEVRRLRAIEDVLEENIRVTNYNSFPLVLELILGFAADFADVFEVRGYHPAKPGNLQAPVWRDSTLEMSYRGKDGRKRQTLIFFTPRPNSAQNDLEGGTTATFRLALAARESATIRFVVTVDGRLESAHGVERFQIVATEYDSWMRGATRIETDNGFFDGVLGRSMSDLRMLWNHQPAGPGYLAAGTPWFDTLFGRDSAIAGLQTLALKPEIARDCLVSLARWQGKKFDSWRDEEPGKIMHELRHGELTRTGELPFSPYFGSVDSTPLFLLLAGEYYAWTADIELLRQLETNLRAGLHWIKKYGDANGDGYVDYEKRSSRGLVNQGWKDSGDSLCHLDGSPVEPPIALVEVQGYVYAAYQRLAPVFRDLGDHDCAEELLRDAEAMERRFNRDFWLEDGYYALALDGEGHTVDSCTSNPGHALWSGIARRSKARQVVQRLLQSDMYSGWGVRTLSADSCRFNPQGYHLGTVWPHDNSIVAMGFKRYGFESELNQLATGLFDAARGFRYLRLPELFGGDERSQHQAPVPYPVACKPQAWAAGAFPLITQAILGLCPDAPNNRLLVVRPRLPEWLKMVSVQGLSVGNGEVDLEYERRGNATTVKVLDIRGDLRVEKARNWPNSSTAQRQPVPVGGS